MVCPFAVKLEAGRTLAVEKIRHVRRLAMIAPLAVIGWVVFATVALIDKAGFFGLISGARASASSILLAVAQAPLGSSRW
jgi:hypothetical protein